MRKSIKHVVSVAAVMAFSGIMMGGTAMAVERLTVKDGGGAVKFVVHDTGNTGVGTDAPGSRLDVREAVTIDGTTKINPIAAYYNTGTLRSKLRLDGVQDWYLNGGDNGPDKGRIQYSTPGGGVGIVLQHGATYDQNAAQIANYPNLSAQGPAYFLGYAAASGLTIISNTGLFGVGTLTPTTKLDVNGNAIRIRTTQTPVSTAACNAGEITWDTTSLYVCTASGAWKKAALTSY